MPQDNSISKLLDLEGIETENIEIGVDFIIIRFHMVTRPHTCPSCGGITETIHDYRMQKVKDLPIQGKRFIWEYRKRRYRCPCCGKRFYESIAQLPKWHRITGRTAAYGIDLLKERTSQKDIAKTLGVSASTVNRWFGLVSFGTPKKLPEVLSIDEFKGNTDGEKFQCILTDTKNKKVLDVLPTRKTVDISQYLLGFQDKSRVKIVVMDMNKAYLETMRSILPKAEIVIDRFHVMRQCTWAIENVRKRIQKSLPAYERRYFKRSRKLLLSRMSSLSEENKAAVEVMLAYSTELTNAYMLKEYFYSFMDSKDKSEAVKRLKWFRIQAGIAKVKEFDGFLTTLINWEKYILNSFQYRYSNGYTEGVNNSIKVIKRTGFGYRNFENFRKRILLVHTA